MHVNVHRLADGATVATFAFGGLLTAAPDRAAAFLGLGPDRVRARSLGIADLLLGPLLLRRTGRSRWMAVRAALSAIVAGCYVQELRRSGSPRAAVGAVAMTALTVVDGAVAQALRTDTGGGVVPRSAGSPT